MRYWYFTPSKHIIIFVIIFVEGENAPLRLEKEVKGENIDLFSIKNILWHVIRKFLFQEKK